MIRFSATDDQKVELYEIASEMAASGLGAEFVAAAVTRAVEYEGTYDLMVMWRDVGRNQDAESEREQILADIQELLDDHQEASRGTQERPYVHFDDLKAIAERVVDFKRELRDKVDAWGGINKLARETGIPQPSLSRFFSTASMPRRTTLYKIARALALPEQDIVTDWIR